MEKQTYNLSAEEVFEKFSTTKKGLCEDEVKKRLKEYGLNTVHKKKNWSIFSLLWSQFNNALMWILIGAGALSFIFSEYRDTVILFLIVFINASIGFFQEFRAEKTLENIKKLASSKAIVLRNGNKVECDASLLVPGDIIYITSGDTIPADGYIIEGYEIYTKEFIFTGESKSAKKKIGALEGEDLSLSDMDNMVFTGSNVTRGDAIVVVTQTGMQTQLGHIAHLVADVKEEETPLQKQMGVLGKDVTILAFIVGALVMIAGHYNEMSAYDNFLFALALAVSVVPNGLPAAISVSLSLGMKKLIKDNVLAKKLNAVETLASVTVICTDKTGTITRNELMVTHVVAGDDEFLLDGQGYDPKGKFFQYNKVVDQTKFPILGQIFKIATLCNDAELKKNKDGYSIIGDPTEGALIVAAEKYRKKIASLFFGEKKLDELPFTSEKMRMSVVYKDKKSGSVMSYVKGSPDVLIDLCTHKLKNEEIVPFSEEEKKHTRDLYNSMSEEALRILAFAQRNMEDIALKNYQKEADKHLVWVGMMGMIDPPRLNVHKAIDECNQSGIKVIMITGDYELTAKAIAKKVGLIRSDDAQIINGKTLTTLSDDDLLKIIKEKEVVFARIAPEQKLRIANILKKDGAIIAMTGDGVNDAPALKRADIGIAMGKIGTDVAKEAADMILLDDNFASIVKVIKEGRTIYQNLRKIVYFAFAANASEFLAVIFGVLLQIPAPITAVQILAIDLGVDVLPSFSLSLEPAEATIMQR
jgi:Ca2+-transporting ATPase